MKKILAVWIMVTGSFFLTAGEDSFSLGFGLSDSAGNFGVNLEMTSPSFMSDFLKVTLESQLDFLSLYRDTPNLSWQMFSTHRLGLREHHTLWRVWCSCHASQ